MLSRLLALRAAFVETAIDQLPADAGINCHDREVRVDRRGAMIERTAIEHQRAALAARGGSQLVHDPASGADKLVLGCLRDGCEVGWGQGVAAVLGQSQTRHHAERRRR